MARRQRAASSDGGQFREVQKKMEEITQLITDMTPVVTAIIGIAITITGFSIGARVLKRFLN